MSENKLQAQELSVINPSRLEDFLVTISGDTLRGFMVENWSDFIEFKVNGKSKPRKFDTSEAKQCTTASGETYIRVYVPGGSEMDFMKILERGKIRLYEHLVVVPVHWSGKSVKGTYDWYANLGKEPLVKVKIENSPVKGRFKKNLLGLINEDAEITELAKSIEDPTAQELRSIIQKFNSRNK